MIAVRVFQDSHQLHKLGPSHCPWSVEWRTNGRRQSKTIGAREDAEKSAAIKRAELIDGSLGLIPRKRWSDFLDEYAGIMATWRSERSRTTARPILRRFGDLMKPAWVSGIDKKLLDQYAAARLADVSAETVRKELRTIRAALNMARDWKYLRDVPSMPNVKGFAHDKTFMREEHFGAAQE